MQLINSKIGEFHAKMLLTTHDIELLKQWFGMRYTNVLYALNTKNTEPNMARVFMDFDDCVASRDKQLNENSMQDTRGDLGAIKIRKEHRGKYESFATKYCGSDSISTELGRIVQARNSTILTASVCPKFQRIKIQDQFPTTPTIITKKGTDKPKAILSEILQAKSIPGQILIFDDRMKNFPEADMSLIARLLPYTTIQMHEVNYQGSSSLNPAIIEPYGWSGSKKYKGNKSRIIH